MSKNREYPERPFVGVGVVVLRGDEVLLVQRGKAPNKGQTQQRTMEHSRRKAAAWRNSYAGSSQGITGRDRCQN